MIIIFDTKQEVRDQEEARDREGRQRPGPLPRLIQGRFADRGDQVASRALPQLQQAIAAGEGGEGQGRGRLKDTVKENQKPSDGSHQPGEHQDSQGARGGAAPPAGEEGQAGADYPADPILRRLQAP